MRHVPETGLVTFCLGHEYRVAAELVATRAAEAEICGEVAIVGAQLCAEIERHVELFEILTIKAWVLHHVRRVRLAADSLEGADDGWPRVALAVPISAISIPVTIAIAIAISLLFGRLAHVVQGHARVTATVLVLVAAARGAALLLIGKVGGVDSFIVTQTLLAVDDTKIFESVAKGRARLQRHVGAGGRSGEFGEARGDPASAPKIRPHNGRSELRASVVQRYALHAAAEDGRVASAGRSTLCIGPRDTFGVAELVATIAGVALGSAEVPGALACRDTGL